MSYKDIRDAAANGSVKDVKRFIEKKGDDVNEKSSNGFTPLHRAAASGRTEIVEFLLSKGADINATLYSNMGGWTPLHIAITNKRAGVVKILVNHGADVNARDYDYNFTPLHMAAIYRSVEITELLLSHGADVNAKANDDMTPLDCAEKEGYAEIAELLKSKGGKRIATR